MTCILIDPCPEWTEDDDGEAFARRIAVVVYGSTADVAKGGSSVVAFDWWELDKANDNKLDLPTADRAEWRLRFRYPSAYPMAALAEVISMLLDVDARVSP